MIHIFIYGEMQKGEEKRRVRGRVEEKGGWKEGEYEEKYKARKGRRKEESNYS